MRLSSFLICMAIVSLLLTGCSTHESQSPEASNGVPPDQLIFYAKDELAAFLDASNLSDVELEQFLDYNSYSMNGVDSRESLDTVIKAITGKPFPVVKDATLTDIIVYMETNQFYARYESETGEIFSFDYSLNETLQDQKAAFSYDDAKIESTFSVNADTLFTAAEVHNDKKNVAGVYFIETPETVVLLRLFNMEATSIKENLQAIYFEDILSIH